MTSESAPILERLIRENNVGWMIDMYAPRERAVPFFLEQLDRVTEAYRARFHPEVSFTPENLSAEADRNPHRIRAFLQALGVSRNLDMLLMVWRILQGLSIREVTMEYREQQSFNLRVMLARQGADQDDVETYLTNDINDAALLRHFGITHANGLPLFDGFFPLSRSSRG